MPACGRKPWSDGVYPTPSFGIALVYPADIDEIGSLLRIVVVDMQGRTVRALDGAGAGATVVDCSEMPAGVYRVVLIGSRGMITGQLIRE